MQSNFARPIKTSFLWKSMHKIHGRVNNSIVHQVEACFWTCVLEKFNMFSLRKERSVNFEAEREDVLNSVINWGQLVT